MKSKKTLIALGVTCTLGVGSAFAASTPFPSSVNESAPWAANDNRVTSMITGDTLAANRHAIDTYASHVGSTSASAGGSIGGNVSGDQLSSATDEDQTLALADQGIYSDFYTVSAPVAVEQWDYYVLSPVSDDYYVLSPGSYDFVALLPSSFEFDNSSPAM